MNIKKQILLLTFFILIIITITSNLFQYKLSELQTKEYDKDAKKIKAHLKNLIEDKKKSTMAIAISLAQGDMVKKIFFNNNPDKNRVKLNQLSEDLHQNTAFKNVWIHVIDKNGVSLVRSWTKKNNDSVVNARADIKELLKNPHLLSSISTGKYTISFKSIVPVYHDNRKLLGFIEVITQFNSISKELKKDNYDSILLVDKRYKKQLTNNISKKFINDYYIANFNSSNQVIELIQSLDTHKEIENQTYLLQKKYFITKYTINDIHNKPMAYYILIKNVDFLEYKDRDTFIDFIRNIIFAGIFFAIFVAIIFYKRHYDINEQKQYFHNIVNTAFEIIIIIEEGKAIDVNRAFFDFFDDFNTLKDFQKKFDCLANLFVEEEGYITKEMDSLTWIEYITQHNHLENKVKIAYHNKEYIFKIAIKKLHHENKEIYTLALTDITKMQAYQKKLEYLSEVDALTKIGNRHYFDMKIENELFRAKRYNNKLSLVMFDIDFFKKINDTYGHDIGDKALTTLAKEVKSLLRRSDIFCRYGGEEFMILMPESSLEEATMSAQRIRKHVQALKIEPLKEMTISLGVTTLINEDTILSLVKKADKALYKAKNEGRNRVVFL